MIQFTEEAEPVPHQENLPRKPLHDFEIKHRGVLTKVASVSGGVAYCISMIPMFASELKKLDGDIYDCVFAYTLSARTLSA